MIDGPLGGQTVGIVSDVATGEVSEIGVVQTVERVVDQPGCLFEIQDVSVGAAETDSDTVTTHAVAWCLMPVTEASRAINSRMRLRYGGRDWQMRGDGRIEHDLDGLEDHVFCLCEGMRG